MKRAEVWKQMLIVLESAKPQKPPTVEEGTSSVSFHLWKSERQEPRRVEPLEALRKGRKGIFFRKMEAQPAREKPSGTKVEGGTVF